MERILLLEDDKSLVTGLALALGRAGYALDTARTLVEANRLWQAGRHDLLMLDVTLPDGTGFDFCREVRRTSGVPILFLTASDEEMDIITGLDLGGDDYITHGIATIWESNQAKADGTTIYSVALQVGTNGEQVLKACATNPTKGYFAIGSSTNIETALKDAFTSIAGSISIAARAGSVADTMGDKVQLVFKDAAPIITTDMAVYAAGNADVYISQGTASYDSAARAIHWTVGNVSEQDKPVMKYRVTIKSGCNPSTGETLLTNEQATFSYIDYLGRNAEA